MPLRVKSGAGAQTDWQCPTCRLSVRARGGLLKLPNNPLVVAAVQAICAGGEKATKLDGGWSADRNGEPVFEFWSGSGGRILVRVAGAADLAWNDVRSFSALTLDTAIALLAALVSDPYRATTCAPRRAPVWLGAPAVIAAKSYSRFGAERCAFAEAVESEIEKLLRLRFEIKAYPAFDPALRRWNDEGITRAGVKLIERAVETPVVDPRDCRRGMPLRLGEWTDHWLNMAGTLWVCPLPAPLLQLDHRENRGPDALAKKVGVLLTLNWGAARKSKVISVSTRALLRRVGALQRPGASTMPSGRIADRLAEALLRLGEANILSATTPSSLDIASRLHGQRWFEDWLDQTIEFARPQFLDPNAEPFAARAD